MTVGAPSPSERRREGHPNTVGLNAKQRRFCEEYIVDLCGSDAARRAGYAPASSKVVAYQLLGLPHVKEEVARLQAERSARTSITADDVLREWLTIARADPNDLVQLRRTCCRYCHGEAHGFQWTTEREFRDLTAQAAAKEEPGPEIGGGFGLDRTAEPHPDCPECRGEGVAAVHALDTRRLSGAARRLYAGAKQTRDGIEIKMRDQDGALDKVARHLGMFVEKHQVEGELRLTLLDILKGAAAE